MAVEKVATFEEKKDIKRHKTALPKKGICFDAISGPSRN
jgi:hypothetical protein